MKIYFVAAISQLDTLGKTYRRVVEILEQEGHKVQSDHIFSQRMENIIIESDEQKVDYYKKFLRWITDSDVVVVEATFPSTVHVGHEISIALEKGKPVIVLYQKGKAPVFLQGLRSDKLILVDYTPEGLRQQIKAALSYSSEQMDTRFNFFISRRLIAYLDWISRKKRIPRAVYLRQLIRREMRKHSEFKK